MRKVFACLTGDDISEGPAIFSSTDDGTTADSGSWGIPGARYSAEALHRIGEDTARSLASNNTNTTGCADAWATGGSACT